MISPLAAHGHSFFGELTAWEWVWFGLESAVFVWVLWLAIKWTLRPGEDDPHHVKRSILVPDAGRDFETSPSPRAPTPSRTLS